MGYAFNVAVYLSKLTTTDNVLPQGAATSPVLSNVIAYRLDERISKLCKKLSLNYTRYADDIAISGENFSKSVIKYVENVIEDTGFTVNKDKTRYIIGNKKKVITGLSVTGNELSLPKSYKREIRQQVHYISTYGLTSHLSHIKNRNPQFAYSLLGKLIFWQSIEPNNSYVNYHIPLFKKLVYNFKPK